jgi:ribosome-associated translation inhibitor RaiA
MKIQIRPRGMALTKTQYARLQRDLELALARFGERIDRVIVGISEGEVGGLKSCEIELRLKPTILKVEDSDTDVSLAIDHAAQRLARSVGRAIETEHLLRR